MPGFDGPGGGFELSRGMCLFLYCWMVFLVPLTFSLEMRQPKALVSVGERGSDVKSCMPARQKTGFLGETNHFTIGL